jgi:hypothetical protein
LTVDGAHRASGFLLQARSSNKDKFKLLVFDRTGKLLQAQDSQREKASRGGHTTSSTGSSVLMFFAAFETYSLSDSTTSATAPTASLPSALTRLEGLEKHIGPLPEGPYLVCVYGDNFMTKSSYCLTALRTSNNTPLLETLTQSDEKLLQMQQQLQQLKEEYIRARDAFEAVNEEVKVKSEVLDKLILDREQSYRYDGIK